METTEIVTRRPRFKRRPTQTFRLTERDEKVIYYVWSNRFLRPTHLHTLVGGSFQQLLRRLRLLYDEGYIDRVRHPEAGVNAPILYALGNKGADVLENKLHIPRRDIEWTNKNRDTTSLFRNHELEVAGLALKRETSARLHPEIKSVSFDTILSSSPEKTRRRPRPEGWDVAGSYNGKHYKMTLYPDAIFGHQFLTASANEKKMSFFFEEVDRGKMPVTRSELYHSSIIKKLLGYYWSWQLWREKAYLAPYCFVNARVLLITTSPERQENFIKAAQKVVGRGPGLGLFLFTDLATASACDDFYSIPWVNARREVISLLD